MSRSVGKPFDLVLLGATGFTGQLALEYLLSEHLAKAPRLSVAIAGRDHEKLTRLLAGANSSAVTPLLVDIDDPDSLTRMAREARVVLSTVGPFGLYGEPVLAACLSAGADYADLSGEPIWIRAMIDKFGGTAHQAGARVAFCSGYDCIPVELGVMMLQKACRARFGTPAPQVDALIRHADLELSGGSLATGHLLAMQIAAKPELLSLMADPFALTPGFRGLEQALPVAEAGWNDGFGAWVAPSLMAFINSKVVHRSNQLRDFTDGRELRYAEAALLGYGEEGRAAAERFVEAAARQKPTLYAPGEGPTHEFCMRGRWDYLFVGRMPDGVRVNYGVRGRYDAGYASTARMLIETGLALLDCHAAPGLSLPGALLGEALVKRLQTHAEIVFGLEE